MTNGTAAGANPANSLVNSETLSFTSGCAARPVTMSIVTRQSLCVQRAATTNHITGGEGGGQAGQRVAYGCQPESTWLE